MTRSSTLPRSVKALTLLLSAITTVACGGGAESAPKSPAGESRGLSKDEELPEPRTVEEAQDQIEHARARLEGPAARVTAEKSTEAPARADHAAEASASRREERPEDTCGSPCRALASMKRAVEALCRMAGDTDDRCVEAKRTLGESTTRISSCRCETR